MGGEEEILHQAERVISIRANYIKRPSGVDKKDIEQELRIEILKQKSRFNKERSSQKTFIERVITWKIGLLNRDFKRKKREIELKTIPFSYLGFKQKRRIE